MLYVLLFWYTLRRNINTPVKVNVKFHRIRRNQDLVVAHERCCLQQLYRGGSLLPTVLMQVHIRGGFFACSLQYEQCLVATKSAPYSPSRTLPVATKISQIKHRTKKTNWKSFYHRLCVLPFSISRGMKSDHMASGRLWWPGRGLKTVGKTKPLVWTVLPWFSTILMCWIDVSLLELVVHWVGL